MTEHLPIQRWKKIFTRYPASELLPNENGEYVTYADHLAALRACEERVEESMDRAWDQTVQLAVAHTRTATLDAAREAVAALLAYESPMGPLIRTMAALAAIDALKEEQ